MDTTTTEMTAAGRRTFDKLARATTAFDTYAALEAACARGYAPSLAERDERQALLGASLEQDGHRVFWNGRAV